ncbi:MAG: glycoside hydrolase family 9 protein [Cytophagales bacterium]
MTRITTKTTLGLFILSAIISFAQTGHSNFFNNTSGWVTGTGYVLSSVENNEMRIEATNVGASFQTFRYNMPSVDLSDYPVLSLSIRSATAMRVRIDLIDQSGMVTNGSPVVVNVSNQNTYQTFNFSFADRFFQTWPANNTVNPSAITGILVYFNAGGNPNFTGTVHFDSLLVGSAVNLPKNNQSIRMNQVGFHPNDQKLAIVVEPDTNVFYLVSENMEDTVFTGDLSSSQLWNYSQERVSRADFSSFTTQGRFRLLVSDIYSEVFEINPEWRVTLNKMLLKNYYYNRASMAIEQPWAGNWPRPSAHADLNVQIHSSAATPFRPAGSTFASPKGWYDAGDFNKYMVNSGISTYNLLALYEHYKDYFDTLNTNIPESANNIPDLLDECLWNIRWMLTCQDPSDGSVYHKVTDANFSGTVMPHNYSATRFAVQRGTAATLNFAAIMAMSFRIFKNFESELPGFADSCLAASIKAFEWATENPNIIVTTNATGISTGIYGDNNLADELNWASTELYISTREDKYYRTGMRNITNYSTPGWNSTNTLGLISLIHHRRNLTSVAINDTSILKTRLSTLANSLRNHQRSSSAYRVALGTNTWDFNWGSNAVAGNQGMVLLVAFKMSRDSSYYHAALSNLDYVLGRNATGYCFVTGIGHRSPKNPHHRISQADGVADPIPGMVVGGANPGQDDGCNGYPSSEPAKSYLDTYCSYSTNEPAINYTSAVAYLSNGLDAIRKGLINIQLREDSPNSLFSNTIKEDLFIRPNPAKDQFYVTSDGQGMIELIDLTGKVHLKQSLQNGENTIQVSGMKLGFYLVKKTAGNSIKTAKLNIE